MANVKHWQIDHNSTVPLHKQVEQFLRKLIRQEEYRNGKLLPGESKIASRLGISRNTVRKAMKRLVQDGLITRKSGVGSRVNEDMVETGLRAWSSFTREMEARGIDVHEYEKKIDWTPPPEEVAQKFDINPDTNVPRLTRLRGDEEEPIVLFISYFHPRIDIDREETFDGLLYDVLEEKYDVVATVSSEKIGARPPKVGLQQKLSIDKNVPILYRNRLVCDAGDRPIEYCYCYYRSDRFVYNLRIHRDDIPPEHNL